MITPTTAPRMMSALRVHRMCSKFGGDRAPSGSWWGESCVAAIGLLLVVAWEAKNEGLVESVVSKVILTGRDEYNQQRICPGREKCYRRKSYSGCACCSGCVKKMVRIGQIGLISP